ncbi:MAG: class I SAM-dependent methyltransferase [Bacteroidota bacterium]
MKFFQYIQYFFYVAANWSLSIAFVLIRHEIRGEKKYNINTTGADELQKLKRKGIDISHATMYMPVSYQLFEEALQQINSDNKKHFFDIGCGKGRAMCVAAHFGFYKISGVDFSKEFCDAAISNLLITKQQLPAINYSVIVADAAVTNIPGDVDCIFLFNPFDEEIMKKVLLHVKSSINSNPRKLNVIYANPLYKTLFLEEGFTETYYTKKLHYFEISILSKN